jgi:hypothetical protein
MAAAAEQDGASAEPPVAEVVGAGARDAVPADLPYTDRRTDTELGPDAFGHRSAVGTLGSRHRSDRIWSRRVCDQPMCAPISPRWA